MDISPASIKMVTSTFDKVICSIDSAKDELEEHIRFGDKIPDGLPDKLEEFSRYLGNKYAEYMGTIRDEWVREANESLPVD